MNVLGMPKEECIQLFFRDDSGFIFRKLPIEDSLVVQKKNNETDLAWMMPFKLLKSFEGYRSMPRGKVLICYSRDVLLDPFNQLGDDEKPEPGKSLVKTFVSDIATTTLYKHEKGPKKSVIDKVVIFLGATMVLFGIAIALVATT